MRLGLFEWIGMRKMRVSLTRMKFLVSLLITGSMGLVLTGCHFGETPAPPEAPRTDPLEYHLRPGDLLTVTFSGLPIPILDHKEKIKDDGTITLQLIGSIKAEGKTTGQLQKEIQAAYVPAYYKQLTITVRAEDLFFDVGGEVKAGNRFLYISGITVVGAIHSAGGLSDFADKTHIQLRRSNGQLIVVNY